MHPLLTVAFVTVIATDLSTAEDAFVKLESIPLRFIIENGANKSNAIAWAHYENKINETGFAYFQVYTNSSYPGEHQAYAAGLLEGHLTKDLIRMHYNNVMGDYCEGQEEYCVRLNMFLKRNIDFINENIQKFRETDPYWHQMELILQQLLGMQDAYDDVYNGTYLPAKGGYTNVTTLLYLSAARDLRDLEHALRAVKPRCMAGSSALVKVLPNFADLFVSHAKWTEYNEMLHILKTYVFPFRTKYMGADIIPGATVSFSSSPGSLVSGEDFSLISSGLVPVETTIGNFNPALWSHVIPQNSLAWMRISVANRLATNGQEWARIFQRFHSGTYNNQWMIIDYKKFSPGKPIVPGTMIVLEELPGLILFTDQSDRLANKTYFPSFNIPFYSEIAISSGIEEKIRQYGSWYTHESNPRANIFRRDHEKVKDMDSMLKLMRYNDYKNDAFSMCNCTPPYSAVNSISARSDLNPVNGTYPFPALGHRAQGATDAKITNYGLFNKLEFLAVSGPTYDSLPVFQWSTSGLDLPHEGHPDVWNFTAHTYEWRLSE